MTRFLLAGAAALGMMSGAAMAQSSGYSSGSSTTVETTSVTPSVSSPWVVTSSSTVGRGATADGDQTATSAWSSRDGYGNTRQTTITNTSYPLTNMIMTNEKTTTFVNGMATERVIVTTSYPPPDTRPPVVMSSTRSYMIGQK
jgi:hypothetical protein